MGDKLILLIVGAIAAVGGSVLAIWLWMRPGSPTTSTGDHHGAGGSAEPRFEEPNESPSDVAALATTNTKLPPSSPVENQEENRCPDESSDVARPTPAEVHGLGAVIPAVLANGVVETDSDPGGKHDPKIHAAEMSFSSASAPDAEGVTAAPIPLVESTTNKPFVVSDPVLHEALVLPPDKREKAPPAQNADTSFWGPLYNNNVKKDVDVLSATASTSLSQDGVRAAAQRETPVLAVLPGARKTIALNADPDPTKALIPTLPLESSPAKALHEARTACLAEEALPQEPGPQNKPPQTDAFSGGAPEGCGASDVPKHTGDTVGGAAENASNTHVSFVQAYSSDNYLGPQAEQVPEPAPLISDPLPNSEETSSEAASAGAPVERRQRSLVPAQYRDRRGKRRALARQDESGSEQTATADVVRRASAEAKLRLMLHPISRTAALSVVLARPAGYPERITMLLGNGIEVGAYSDSRYDDVDIEWTADLLSREIRLDCKEGYQWLRSRRRIHIFGEVTQESGVLSIGSVGLLSPSTIVCRSEDAAAVQAAALACGSTTLVSHDHWNGIPDGWIVLSGYRPAHAATCELPTDLTVLDPGDGIEIQLSGGLRIRAAAFAESRPPRIEIVPFPAGATVAIDGRPATLGDDGAWTAEGWDTPGDHLIDVVPGPSAAYQISKDPWTIGGWEAWDAHPERFGASVREPWSVAQICGASVSGPGGEHVVAAHALLSVVCLGLRNGSVALRRRPDAPVAVGLLKEPPAFLISSSGLRRKQGRISWLSPLSPAFCWRTIDPLWAVEVRSAAARRLPLDGGGAPAEEAWRKARERARGHKRQRS